jgi:hypothetical protein
MTQSISDVVHADEVGNSKLERLTDDLAAIADWKTELQRKIRLAQSAKGYGRTCPRARRRPGRGGCGRCTGGTGGMPEIRGSTPCKANCPCTSARDVKRGRGEEASANHQRWRTAAVGCTGENHRAHRRAIEMRASTGVIRPKPLPVDAR